MVQINLKDASPIYVEAVVRTVPHQREVVRGSWLSDTQLLHPVYAKKFTGPRAVQHYSRDLKGISDLQAAKIPTPALLFQGMTQDEDYVLVFLAIPNAFNAMQTWQHLNTKARYALAKKLVKTVAQHHDAGLLQTDLYLKNFLVDGDVIYTLDGDGVRKYKRLSKKQALKNLSILLSKLDVLQLEAWLADLLNTYTEARSLMAMPDRSFIKKMVNRYRQRAASHYADKKVFRQCSDVNVTASQGLFVAASSDANITLPSDMAELDVLIQPHNLLKNGNTCTVGLAEIDNKKIVIKRYNIKNFWHGLSRAFRPSRAETSWANAHRLNILGIATAKPIAVYEQRTFGLRGKAYFLAEYLDLPDVAEYFAQTQNKTKRAEAVKNLVILFYKLYLLQISHGDMKATNIKMQGTQPVLIDLDSMRQHRKSNPAAHVRDLQRFMQNWKDNTSLYNAFVKTFKVVYPDDSLLIRAGIATNKE